MKNQVKKSFEENRILKDAQLVELAVAGEREAREKLAVACLPRVSRLVYMSYGQKEDVDDVVQVAMVTVFKDLSRLRNCAGFRTWLDTVVYNVVRSHGRRRGRWLSMFSSSELDDSVSGNGASPEEQSIHGQTFIRLQGHLGKIQEKKRTAVVMSLFFGYVDSEIAQIMDCGVEAAKKRVQHGRRELFERVQKDPSCRHLLEEVVK